MVSNCIVGKVVSKGKRMPVFKVVKNMPVGGCIGYHQPGTNMIYIKKGHDSDYLRKHETYHYMKRHPDKPRNKNKFIDHEIEAEAYAIKNARRHRPHIEMVRAMLSTYRDTYGEPLGKSYNAIGKRLKLNKVDKEWQDAYKKVGNEIKSLR